MNETGLQGFFILLLIFPPLVFLQRFLQRDIQSIFLLLTRQPEISMAIFSLIFLPGVLLHETSHFVAAHLLGVRTGRFSLIPKKMESGRLQLGYVETASTDVVRDAIIGAAPLIAGGTFIALIGLYGMGLDAIWGSLSQWEASSFRSALASMIDQPDFWLWFYLTFTISSTMTPSPSDRKAWLPFIVIIIILVGIVLFFGAGPWILSRFGSIINSALNAVSIVFGIAVLSHLVLLPPVWIIRKTLSRLTGYQVV
jgi:hypothetical protein